MMVRLRLRVGVRVTVRYLPPRASPVLDPARGVAQRCEHLVRGRVRVRVRVRVWGLGLGLGLGL